MVPVFWQVTLRTPAPKLKFTTDAVCHTVKAFVCVCWQCVWFQRWEWVMGKVGLKSGGGGKEPPATQCFVDIVTGKRPELWMKRDWAENFLSIKQKESRLGCVLKALRTWLGDKNSPADAGAAGTLLALHLRLYSFPPHLLYNHLLPSPRLLLSPRSSFCPLFPPFTLSLNKLMLLEWPIFLTHLYTSFPTPVGQKRSISYFLFSNDASALIRLGKAIWMALFPMWLISRLWGSFNQALLFWPTLQGRPKLKHSQWEKISE